MVYLSLGSNLGDKQDHLEFAVAEIGRISAHLRYSSFYLTEAQEDIDQPDYLNAAVECSGVPEPEKLLEVLLLIEQKAGRKRDSQRRYGPRTLDIDILLYNDLVINSDRLIIPHPAMLNRAFVLYPLLELNNELIHPVKGKKIADYLDNVAGQGIRKLSTHNS